MDYDSMIKFTEQKNREHTVSLLTNTLGETVVGDDPYPTSGRSSDIAIAQKYKYNFLE